MNKKYFQKFLNVFHYIDENLAGNLSIDKLSDIANTSKFHFHRQFSSWSGLSVSKVIQEKRMKKAAYLLAFRQEFNVLQIALEVGFENAESLSRAFKKHCGLTPTLFRKQPVWDKFEATLNIDQLQRRISMTLASNQRTVEIVDFALTKIAVLEHLGAPSKILQSVKQFIEWRKQAKVHPGTSNTYNIIYHDPRVTPPEEFRFDIAASVVTDVSANDFAVITKEIPAGRCARIRNIGSDDSVGEAIDYLYSQWLPNSEETLRDYPCFTHRVTLFPDVAENQMITDVYLPIV